MSIIFHRCRSVWVNGYGGMFDVSTRVRVVDFKVLETGRRGPGGGRIVCRFGWGGVL